MAKSSSKSEFTFQPLNERTVVRRFAPKEKTEGGLYIPDQSKDIPIAGRVVATCEGSGVKADQVVVFAKYAGTTIAINGEELILLKKEDLLGIYAE